MMFSLAGLRRLCLPLVFSLLLILPASAADGATPTDTGDTAWVIVASALVLFMTLPGLALFYGGLVRARNLLSVLMHCFVICCIVSLIWAIFGYSLAFGDGNALIGSFDKAFLAHLSANPVHGGLPEIVFALFQMTFAIITPALVIGAFPERARFSFVMIFTAAWFIIVYLPVAHWLWGGGWAAQAGAIDFAGGIVVHTSAGVTALIAAIMIGPRDGFPHHTMPPHSPGLTMTGAGMLWVGWFGFNGGSALAANASAGYAIMATHLAAAAAALTWMVIEWLRVGKPTSIGIVTGCVAGLATVTPASGYIGPMGAIALGIIGAAFCFSATNLLKQRFKIDDSLDVFAVHGVGGVVGSVLVAVFALPSLGGAGFAEGMGMSDQLIAQIEAVGATALWAAFASFVLIKLIGAFIGARVTREQEYEGLDIATHGERAYDIT